MNDEVVQMFEKETIITDKLPWIWVAFSSGSGQDAAGYGRNISKKLYFILYLSPRIKESSIQLHINLLRAQRSSGPGV